MANAAPRGGAESDFATHDIDKSLQWRKPADAAPTRSCVAGRKIVESNNIGLESEVNLRLLAWFEPPHTWREDYTIFCWGLQRCAVTKDEHGGVFSVPFCVFANSSSPAVPHAGQWTYSPSDGGPIFQRVSVRKQETNRSVVQSFPRLFNLKVECMFFPGSRALGQECWMATDIGVHSNILDLDDGYTVEWRHHEEVQSPTSAARGMTKGLPKSEAALSNCLSNLDNLLGRSVLKAALNKKIAESVDHEWICLCHNGFHDVILLLRSAHFKLLLQRNGTMLVIIADNLVDGGPSRGQQ
ncbi:hypothetical protein QBC35DRAFT_463672 [Podospora australis]|uniref:Uncharacterized protein n=1 Tax=Podospora australis TaxID=1536484 RepID=A0AAN6WSY5_9PEZI|nr:hypothetical protein QBC35DRAFT_463672 [Podospora australis]